MRRNHKEKETPQHQAAHGKNSMHAMAKQNIRLVAINTTRNTLFYPVKIIEFERAGAGPPAKSSRKPKLLQRTPRTDPIGLPPFRALMRKETVHWEKGTCTIAKQNICSPVINTTRKKSVYPIKTIDIFEQTGAEPAAKSPGKPKRLSRTDPTGLPPFRAQGSTVRREKLSKTSSNPQALTGTTEVKSKSLEATIEVEPQLRTNITDAVLDCITSTSFKNQLALRIVGEIDDILAKAVSQVQEKQHAVKFGTAGDKTSISREQQSSNNVFRPGFSDGVASVIGYALIEVREDVKKTFRSQSHKFQTVSPTAFDSVTGMVDKVFESMLDSLIPQLKKTDVCTERNPSTIDSLYCHEFDTVFDKILPSNDSDFNQCPVYEPRGSSDESSVTAQDSETLDIVKERTDSPRRSTKVPFSTVSDQSSGPEIKAKDEVEDILADSGSMSHLDVPLTSRFKSDSETDTSVLELTATSPTEIVDHMSRSDKVAEEGLVAKSDVELGQIMAAPSEENTPSDVTSKSLELIGHQEGASPVPSTPSSDQPAYPRGSARRRVHPIKASSLPNIFSEEEDGIFDQSHQKVESDGKHRLSLTGMEMGSSGSRSHLDEPQFI